MQRIAPAFWGNDLQVVSTIDHPSEPLLYVFANVLGVINITAYNTSQYYINRPFEGHQSFKRGIVLEYDSGTLGLKSFSTASSAFPSVPGADFSFVNAVWANDTLWVAYNLGEPSTILDPSVILYFATAGESQFGFANPQSTGILRYNLTSLLPARDVSYPPSIIALANLTTSALGFDGVDLFMSGSTTFSPLIADFKSDTAALDLNENMGPRSSCVGSREADNFEWCAGAEDGWNFQVKVAPPPTNTSLSTIHFVYSQSTGPSPSSPSRHVKALSVSVDKDQGVYSCYSSNNLWVTLGDSKDSRAFTIDGQNDFNHSSTTPNDNLEVFCSIRDGSLLTYTIEGVDGDVQEVYATVEPISTSSSRHIYFAASTSTKTVFNITGVQGSGISLGYTLSANPGVGSSKVTQMHGTQNGELFVSGLFKGKLEGDPSAPISYVTGPASVNSIFVFYYNKTDSPTQIAPHAIFTLGKTGVNFLDAKIHPTKNSTFSSPQFRFSGIYQTNTDWKYGNTDLRANGGVPTFVWGVYSPEQLSRQPSPIFVPILSPPVLAPTSAAPSSIYTTTATLTFIVVAAILAILSM
jgi:hypothetical protein